MDEEDYETSPENRRRLDAIDDVLYRRNLCSTLNHLTAVSLFTDPVYGQPYPTEEEYAAAKPSERAMLSLRRCIHLWHSAYFAMVATCKGNQFRKGDLSEADLRTIVNCYNDYVPPILTAGEDISALGCWIRIAYQQFPYQRRWWAGITRARFMFNYHSPECSLRLPEAIQGQFGATYDEILGICDALSMLVHNRVKSGKDAAFTWEMLADGYLPWVDRTKLKGVLDSLTQTQLEFRTTYDRLKSSDTRQRIYDFNPLLDRPLVRIDSYYYAPVPALLLLWATEGIAYRLRDQLGAGPFGDSFGKAFEAFVANLLTESGREFVPEVQLARGENTADFIVMEEDEALIMDCKSRKFAVRGRYGIQDAIEIDTKESIVKGIRQALRTETYVRERRRELTAYPGISDISHFSYAVVTLDNYYLANSKMMRRLVKDELGCDVHYEVMSCRDLELLLANPGSANLVSFLR